MTLRTSLFNKGIYKSTVKRYLWGSVLYFVILFLTTTLPWLSDDTFYSSYADGGLPTLLNYSYFAFPMIMTWFVPTVAGLLVYRFMHSKKTSVFTHSLPISRNAIYFSSVLGGLTLMFLPVIANGLIMAVASFTTLDMTVFSAALVWTGMNLLALFLMFSVASFAASLTGNSFAVVAINVLVHTVLMLLTGLFGGMAEEYIFGFTSSNALFESLAEGNFPAQAILFTDNIDRWFVSGMAADEIIKILVSVGCAIILYAFGWLLYKKRNLENAEDIAGFKVLNPIFKYLLTSIVALASISAEWLVLTTIILTVVTYFGCEMLLKKTMKVWKSYKGFAVFATVFIVFAGYIMNGSFFGFETYVPDAGQVQEAIIYNTYGNFPLGGSEYYSDPGLIKDITEIHRGIVTSEKYFYKENPRWGENREALRIEYVMKNGGIVSRQYWIDKDEFKTFQDLYKYEEFKKTNELLLVFETKPGVIYKNAEINYFNRATEYIPHGQISDVHKALCTDIKSMNYEQLHNGEYMDCSIMIEVDTGGSGYQTCSIDIREDFTNTLNWLKANGYIE